MHTSWFDAVCSACKGVSDFDEVYPVGPPMTVDISTAPVRSRILVVEDEVLICLLIETILSDAGYEVLIANSLSEAIKLIDDGKIDAALLDLNVRGQKVYPVAEKLAVIGVPFVFATGGAHTEITEFARAPTVGKPFQEEELLGAVARLVSRN